MGRPVRTALAGMVAGLVCVAIVAQTPPPAKGQPIPQPRQKPPMPAPEAGAVKPAEGPKAVVQVVGDERFDFGAFWPDATKALQHTFTLKNTGESVLQILKVQPG